MTWKWVRSTRFQDGLGSVTEKLMLSRRGWLQTAVGMGVGPLASGARASLEPIRLAVIEGFSGPFANAGEAVWRNLTWAVERVNARGGIALAGGPRPLALVRMDSQGQTDLALTWLKSALRQGIGYVLQGNSSATAAALIDALNRNNERDPAHRALFLNYAAVDPALTRERCSFWHFRFDADAQMRMDALTDVLRSDRAVQRVYLINQDYSFGRQVQGLAKAQLHAKRPDIQIVGDDYHALGRVKDFLPYASKIRASGAQAVITGNWGNDLTLLVKACHDLGLNVKFYTFYGNSLGAPSALGEAGVGRVLAVAEWHPNVGGAVSDSMVAAFHRRFPRPQDDYLHARMQAMIEVLAESMRRAGGADPTRVAGFLETAVFNGAPVGVATEGRIRASDHQFLQPLYVSVMEKQGAPDVRFDVEGSGYGFRTVLRKLPTSSTERVAACHMRRPQL